MSEDNLMQCERMIESLTPEQAARFPEFVEKWTKIGLCTEPADRPRAERAIRGLYALANLDPPQILWCRCPISGVATSMRLATVHSAVRSAVDSSVSSAVGSAVGSAVDSAVESAVRSAVESAVGLAVDSAVDSAVESAVGLAVGLAVDSAVESSVRSAVRSAVDSAVGSAGRACYAGSLWPGWVSWRDYVHKVLGVEFDQSYAEYVQSAGYLWMLDGVAIATDRPEAINLDDAGRLHCESGMSIRYRSGWGLWHWHGVRVDEQIICRPETQTLQQIGAEQNEEVKRIRIERFGWERYLLESNASVLDSRRNDVEGTRESLMQVGPMTVLVCHCPSTARVYTLEVDPSVRSCEAAQNWLWQKDRIQQRYGVKLNIIGRS